MHFRYREDEIHLQVAHREEVQPPVMVPLLPRRGKQKGSSNPSKNKYTERMGDHGNGEIVSLQFQLLRGVEFGIETKALLFKRLCAFAGLHCEVNQ